MDNKLYVHGGFEPEAPSIPTDVINIIDVKQIFLSNPKLKGQAENMNTNNPKFSKNEKNLISDRPHSTESTLGGDKQQIRWNRNAII